MTDEVGNNMAKTLGDFDIWFKPCDNCGYDTGRADDRKRKDPRCWKCGRKISRDYSDRALKDKS